MRPRATDCRLRFLQPPNLSHRTSSEEFSAAYQTWHSVWADTLKQFGSDEKLFSDSFSRQDEILSIFHERTCIAILLLRWMDFARFNYASDSYFKNWTEVDIARLTKFGKKIMISSFLTVHPEYRMKQMGFSFRDVILDLMVQRFLISPMDSISGITRREKHVHTTSYSLGATAIRKDIPYHNDADRVDLLVFYRQEVRLLEDPTIRLWSDSLFSEYSQIRKPVQNAA